MLKLVSSCVFLVLSAARAESPVVRVASGMILENNRVLLLERSMNEKIVPGYFNLPGGRLQPGEDEAQAVMREVREETGLEVSIIRPYNRWGWTSVIDGRTKHFLLTSFLMKLEGPKVVRLSPEHISYIWAAEQELSKVKITPELSADLAIGFQTAKLECRGEVIRKP